MGAQETPIQKAILDYLHLRGHHAFRVNTQGVPLHGKDEGKFRPSPMKGVSDIIGCFGVNHPSRGIFYAIEVKSSTGKITPEQAIFLKSVVKNGAVGVIARSVQDVIDAGF